MNITLNGTKITQDSKTLAFEKNNNVDEIVITVDTDESWSYKLDVKYPDKYNVENEALYNIIDLGRNGDICSVTLTREMLPFNGKYTVQLRGINGDKVYHSDTFEVWVKYSIEPRSTYDPVPSEFYQIENKLDDKVNEAKQYAENAEIASTRMPKISPNNTWLIWDAETGDYVDTGIMASGDSVTVDGKLSGTSENPVQNRVVKSALDSLSEEIADLEGKIPSGVGSGLTDDEKTLMLSLFQNAVFNDIDMSATLNQLKNLFNGGEPNTFSVTYNLTDVTSDNTAEVAKEAFPFTATLTASEGLLIREDNLSITMGGEDITDSVYANGVITIPLVKGAIVITAMAKDASLLYAIPEETVFDGTAYIDTGVSLFDESKSFSILVDFTSTNPRSSSVFSEADPTNTLEPYKKKGYCLYFNGAQWRVSIWYNIFHQQFINTKDKLVITYDNLNHKHTVYHISDGALTSIENDMDMSPLVGVTSGLRLGTGYSNNDAGFTGTIHKFEAYSKVVDEATIHAFLGVE